MHRPGRLLALGGAIWLAAIATARAASFDCTKAASPMGQAICADPALSSADEALAKLYRVDLDQLSPDGRTALRDSQRSWLGYTNALCRPGQKPLNPARWGGQNDVGAVAGCLTATFRDRNKVLTKAVIRLDGMTFLSTTIYRVHPNYVDKRGVQAVSVSGIFTLLQIDQPTTSAQRLWNATVLADYKKSVSRPEPDSDSDFDGGDDDVDISFSIISASPDLIDFEHDYWFYANGTPHGQPSGRSILWSLKLGRPLMAVDMFRDRAPWKTALAELAYKQFDPNQKSQEARDDLDDVVSNEETWEVRPSGLQIRFWPYSLGCYVCSPAPVTIPWSTLKPYLQPKFPFDPAAIHLPPP